MESEENTPPEISAVDEALSGLQQALQRLTSPQVEPIQTDLEDIKNRIQELNEMLNKLESGLTRTSSELESEIQALSPRIQTTRNDLEKLQVLVSDEDEVSKRISPVLVDVIQQEIATDQDRFAEAISPIMGPAIRNQIRNAREDIIESLYPVVGEIISKAISEAFREFSRNIDNRLRQGLDVRSRWGKILDRIRGVSETDRLLRGSINYTVHHAFLIHRDTGLLIQHLTTDEDSDTEYDMMSGMLTAIQDFVKDSFGQGQGDLEEITHGNQRILLASGRGAYLAVVLDGVEPTGYSSLMDRIASDINIENEIALKEYEGDNDTLPDFTPTLNKLINPDARALGFEQSEALDTNQKRAFGVLFTIALIALAGTIFACVFTVRLWPVAFGATATPIPTATSTLLPTLTPTPLPTNTVTPSPSPTWTATPVPTSTFTPAPTDTPTSTPEIPEFPLRVVSENLFVRTSPIDQSFPLGVLFAGSIVEIIDQEGNWFFVRLVSDEENLQGWAWGDYLLPPP